MQNTTTATATTAKKQDMIAVSPEFKAFIVSATETFGASSASKEYMAATQKEVCDAMQAFVEAHRDIEDEELSDEGEIVIVKTDLFALEMNRTLALRAATSRANSASSKLAEKEKELNELKALLAKLQGNA